MRSVLVGLTTSLNFLKEWDEMEGEVLRSLVQKAQPFVKKHAATILTCVGTAGVVATAITSAKATPLAIELLDEAKAEKGADLTKTEKFLVAGPAYIPATVIGVSTIACILGAHVLNKCQQAALASAYALLNSTYNEYREKVVELLGEEADIEIKNEIAKDKYDEAKVVKTNVEPEPNDICLFFEEFRGQYFETTLQAVKDAEYQLNRKLALHDYAELNDFYKFMQLPPTEYGAVFGWSTWASGEFYGYEWIEFHHIKDILPDGTEYYRIEMPFPPTEDYLDW